VSVPPHQGSVAGSTGSKPEAEPTLQAGALGLSGAIMQSVTLIAPAVAGLFFIPFITSQAGVTSPLAYPIGFLVTLALGFMLVELAKHMPSAGGYFTYISRAVSPRAGFLSAWIFTFYVPMVGGPICAFFGYILEGEFKGNYGWTWFHWWYAPIVMLPVISYLAYRGIEISTRVIVVLGALEMIIVLALAVWGIFDPGKGGFNVSSFNPGNVANWSGFSLAVVFSIQGFTGWDGAAPLAEETANPRRNVPRAVIGSILILGAFLIIVSWGITLGWGTSVIASLPGSPELPGLVLAHHFWSRGWVLVLFAIFSSVMAVSLSSNNVSTRMWYSMARAGALPKPLARLHPTYRTPVNAIAVQFVLNVVSGLVVGLWLGPAKGFNLLTGLTLVLAVLVVYTMANLGVFLFYRRERPQEFSWFKHAAIPVALTAFLAYLLYKSFDPWPASPYGYAPIIIGIWLAIGVGVLFVMQATGREDWVLRAGASVADAEARGDLEHGMRPV
jgi:amino acid transporter